MSVERSAKVMDEASNGGSPDEGIQGFLDVKPDPARYDGLDYSPNEPLMTIAALVPQGARVLDVGCGAGALAQLLREVSGCSVVGIEPDTVRASIARDRGIAVHQGYLTVDLLNVLGTFDTLIFADVLEHIADPARILCMATAALHANGRVIVSIPNVAHWSVRCNLLRGIFTYQPLGIMDATHLRWFTRATVLSLFERIGFEAVSVHYTIGAQLPVYARMPWRWLGLRLRQRILRTLVRWFPCLFACQFVVEAKCRSRQQ